MDRARNLPLLVLLAAFVCCPACLEAESTTRVEPDGSGTFVETVTIDLAKVALARRRLKAAAGLDEMEDLPSLDPFGMLDPTKRLAELKAADGIADVTSTQERLPKKRLRTVLRGRFRSLEHLYAGGLIDGMQAVLLQVPKKKAWRLDARSLYDNDAMEAANRETVLATRQKLLAGFRSILEGLRIQRTIVFPTRVIETNGTVAKDERTVTWTLKADDLADPRRFRQWVLFEAAANLTLKPFPTTDPEPKKDPEPKRDAEPKPPSKKAAAKTSPPK